MLDESLACDQCAVVPAPVDSLPAEVLAKILNIGTMQAHIEGSGMLFPHTISSVGKRFREVAISTPSIWATIKIDLQRPFDLEFEGAALWLKRSQSFPLDLDLAISVKPSGTPKEKYLKVMSMMLQHTHRWESVKIVAWEDTIPEVVELLRDVAAPILQKLNLQAVSSLMRDGRDGPFFSIAASPALRILSLAGLRLRSMPQLHGVTSLHLRRSQGSGPQSGDRVTGGTYKELCDIFQALPYLNTLELSGSKWVLPPNADLKPIEIPTLHFLCVNCEQYDDLSSSIVAVFANLSISNLETLELVHWEHIHAEEFLRIRAKQASPPQYPSLNLLKIIKCGGFAFAGYSQPDIFEGMLSIFPAVTQLVAVHNAGVFKMPPHVQTVVLDWVKNQLTGSAFQFWDWLVTESKSKGKDGKLTVMAPQHFIECNKVGWKKLGKRVTTKELDSDAEQLHYMGKEFEHDDSDDDRSVNFDEMFGMNGMEDIYQDLVRAMHG